MDRIERFVGSCTLAETNRLAAKALEALPESDAMAVVKAWIEANNLEDEMGAIYGEEEA